MGFDELIVDEVSDSQHNEEFGELKRKYLKKFGEKWMAAKLKELISNIFQFQISKIER